MLISYKKLYEPQVFMSETCYPSLDQGSRLEETHARRRETSGSES